MVRRLVQAPGPVLEPVSSAVRAPLTAQWWSGWGRPSGPNCWPTWRFGSWSKRRAHAQAGSGRPPRRRRARRHEPGDVAAPAHALRPTFEALATRAHLAPRADDYARSWPLSAGVARRRCSPSPVASTRTAARSGPWACSPPPRLWHRPKPPRRTSRRLPGGWRPPDRYAPSRGVSRFPGRDALRRGGGTGEARQGFPHVVSRAAGPARCP